MKLSTLIRDLAASGDLGTDPEVFGVRHDSRTVEPGELFVTWSGAKFDGRLFAGQAIERGAVAILADSPRPAETPREIPWLEAADPRALLGDLAAPLYGHPDRALTLVGVTGTNGKSTVVELCANILESAGLPCGRIGTLGYTFAGDDLAAGRPAERTTPEASDLFRLLAAMRDRGARAAAMEVSSHALVQGRVRGARFDIGVFTNLTRDHLDFHGDFETYYAAKRRLFEALKPAGRGVANLDDAYGRRLADELGLVHTFGSSGSGAAVRPAGVNLDAEGMHGALATPRGQVRFRSALLGRYNIANLLAAAAVLHDAGAEAGEVARRLSALTPPAGRMERLGGAGEPLIVVDYAHSPDALENVLRALRGVAQARNGSLCVVFGCGGDRDPGKRPMMGKIAGDLADLPIATSDNPRSEDPLAILSAVEEGLKASTNRNYRIVPDRREAIRRAVTVAMGGGWSVLVAGKGHENEQIVGNQRLPFSDRNELERAIVEQRGAEARG